MCDIISDGGTFAEDVFKTDIISKQQQIAHN